MAESRKSTKKVAENRKREVLRPGKQKIKATESRKTIIFSRKAGNGPPIKPPLSSMHFGCFMVKVLKEKLFERLMIPESNESLHANEQLPELHHIKTYYN